MNIKEEQFLKKVKELQEAFEDVTGNKDAFNYNRIGELQTAILLGLNWNSGFDSKDATDKNGNPIELKSTTQATVKGTYNGLSAKDTIEEFVEYMSEKYPNNTRHIFVRKENGNLAEVWELSSKNVLDIVIGKVSKNFYPEGVYDSTNRRTGKPKADPRPGASVSMTEIKKYGEQLELYR